MQPRQLGRYRIVKELGRGAMGRVYLAHDPEIDRSVAIKTVQAFAALPEKEQADARARFQREARSAGRLLHPNIVTVFDVGEAEGLAYLAMELIEGQTLAEHCRPGDLLPTAAVIESIAQVAEALDYAHAQGIVHRDVKPANLMLGPSGTVKVMDFGLARASEASLTHDGTLLGTPGYMSPEQIRGEPLDGRSDLFSLGVVLFELLSGEKPFPGDSISSIIYRIVNDAPRDVLKLNPSLAPELAAFLTRALAKDPDQRFPDGKAFAQALRVTLAQGSAPSAPASPAGGHAPGVADPLGLGPVDVASLPAPARAVRRKSSPLPYVAGLLVLVALLAAGAYALRDRLGISLAPAPPVTWQVTARTDPPDLPLLVDGKPIDPAAGGVVRFSPDGPFPVLSTSLGCRTVERPLEAADAGREVVLVPDATELHWRVDPGVAGAEVAMNGQPQGTAPVELAIDLCRETRIEVQAPGYRGSSVEIAALATPLAARNRLADLVLQPLPTGRLELPDTSLKLAFFIDGERRSERQLDLVEGEHELRYTNDKYWIDVTRTIRVAGGETLRPDLEVPALATLKVQPFPPNCQVFLSRPGGAWKLLGDAPIDTRLAVGEYRVKVRLNTTGEERAQSVRLTPGQNLVRIKVGT